MFLDTSNQPTPMFRWPFYLIHTHTGRGEAAQHTIYTTHVLLHHLVLACFCSTSSYCT